MAKQLQLRRGNLSWWTTNNPVLADGEMVLVSTTNDYVYDQYRIGDGLNTFSSLAIHSFPFNTTIEQFLADAEAARDAAQLAETNAETAETNAEAAEALAEKWAENPEDVEVESGKFSAKHYSNKAETAWDNFDDTYLGAKATDPAVDNDGGVLKVGAMYFNSTSKIFKVWDGSAWVTHPALESVRSQSTTKAPTSKLLDDSLSASYNDLRTFQAYVTKNSPTSTVTTTYDASGNATIVFSGDWAYRIGYKSSGQTYCRLCKAGETKTFNVLKQNSLYIDINTLIATSTADSVIDTAYSSENSLLASFPTGKLLLFSNWIGDVRHTHGLFTQFIREQSLSDSSSAEIKVMKHNIYIVENSINGNVTLSYDSSGNATIIVTGDMLYRRNAGNSGYCRVAKLGETKTFVIPKNQSLYLSYTTLYNTASANSVLDESYTTETGVLVTPPIDKILLFANWFGNFKSANGVFADYISLKKIDESTIIEKSILELTRNKTVAPLNYNPIHKKIKPFIQNYLNQSKDIEIVLLGDSIFARTVHTTLYSTEIQQSRPPMMISKNIASGIWDKVNPGNITHSRWDKSGVFTETGTGWASYFGETLKAAWDDAGDRAGETREFLSTDAASIAFGFSAGMRRLNFIYRTSTEGNNALTIAITAGAGVVEVYDDVTAAWVEANGYTFSQKYTATGIGYGNTEYQRRLKFRKVAGQEATAHTILINKPVTVGAESLMYWGIEQTNRDYIVSVRNIARGGHDMQSLWATIRTEFDNFGTDLVLFELPIINMKTYAQDPAYFWTSTVRGVQPKLLDAANPNSLISISSSFTNFQVMPMLLNDTRVWINSDGTLKDFEINGKIYNADSYFNYLTSKFWENETAISLLNAYPLIKENSIKTFGSYYTAWSNTPADSKNSYSRDSTHPNDFGVDMILNYILPIFDFNVL